jgi:hypothetical protein
MKRIVVFSLLLLTSCIQLNQPIQTSTEVSTLQFPTNTSNVEVPTYTATQSATSLPPTSSPTDTSLPTIALLTQESTNTEIPELDSRIEELQITLTAAAIQIATLEAENQQNETQSNSASPTYYIPSNARTVIIISKTILRETTRNNKAGKPVMVIKEPRVVLRSGSRTWVYAAPITADGGTIYYEIYDPDGVVTRVFYIRQKDIQVRGLNFKSKYGSKPEDVALAKFVDRAVLRKIKKYNNHGVPVMIIREPRVKFRTGDQIWVYPKEIRADGGVIYFEVYDPNDKYPVVLFVRKVDIIYFNLVD